MRTRYRALLAVIGLLALLDAGCERWRERRRLRDQYGRYDDPYFRRRDPYAPDYPQPYPPPPVVNGSVGVGAGVGVGPGRPEVLTPQPAPAEPAPGTTMPPATSGYLPPANGVKPTDHLHAGPGSTAEPPLARAAPAERKPVVAAIPPDLLDPKVTEKAENIPPASVPEKAPAAPVGIPLFAEVKEKAAATGLKPDTEGLDWLKANSYRTVLHLRRKGADDSADREQIEKRGLKYQSLEVAPAGLTKELVAEFGQTVNDASNQPVFVYDKDRTLAGAMWYLHLRLNEKLADDVARDKARLYGLKEDGSDEATQLWLAIQNLIKAEKS